MKRVGVWLNDTKEKRLAMKKFSNEYKSDDLKFVWIDLNYDLELQGPFDVIVHKFLDLQVKQLFGCKKSSNQINNILRYLEKHKNIILLDPLETIIPMLNRYKQNALTNKVVQHQNLREYVFAPKFCRLDSNNISDCFDKCINSGLEFPIVCKPEIAHGHNIAHEMRIVFNKDGFKDIATPCISQTFINHNARLFKIFVVGKQIYICDRPSVKNLYSGNQSTLFFNTNDVSKEESHHELTELDEGHPVENPQPCRELFKEVSMVYREESGLNLFGIDLILCNKTSKYAIIDANCFPGYEKMPYFYSSLESLIREKLELSQKCNSSD